MESEGKTATSNEISQEILKTEDSKAQTQCMNNLNRVNQHNNKFTNASKIFVGGLPADLTKDELKAYFEKFGSIEDVVVMSDKETNKPRRFGFVTFDSPETAINVLKNRFYELKNKRVEVKKSVSKDRMTRKFENYYDTYNAYSYMYNGNTLPYVTPAYYGNYGGYYYGMNTYGYGAYSGLGYEGLSYFYYPYQNPNPCYYNNTCSYQNPYYYADTYSYQSPYNYYGNASKHNSYKYRNRTPVVIKKNPSPVNNGDGDQDVKKNANKNSQVNNGDGDHDVRKDAKLISEVNDEESVVRVVLENGDGNHGGISDGLSLCCNREVEGDGVGGCAEGIQALSLCSGGSGEEMGGAGQASSCTIDS